MSFRLVTHPKMDGRFAMAVDEALTEAVGEGRSPETARLYGFFPPALSLGRFQRIREGYDPSLMARDGVVLVRRPTGGHAVLHDDELTYSIVLSKEATEKRLGSFKKRAIYELIAGLLLKGLANLGIGATVNARLKGDMRNPDCFGSSGEYEICGSGGRKLIGSAQMTTRRAVLQQGSIPISNPGGRVLWYIRTDAPPDSRASTSLAEEAGRGLSFEQARDAFAKAFREALGTVDSTLSPEEEESARRILDSKYATDAWNLMY